MIRALLDTNVLASAIAGATNRAGTPGELSRQWRRGVYVLVHSAHIRQELKRILHKQYFRDRLSDADIEQALRALERWGEQTAETVAVTGIASHPEDDHVLAAAVSAPVDYLVTGDRMLLDLGAYEGVRIVSPSAFLAILDRDLTPLME